MLLPMPQRLIVVIFYVSLPRSNHHRWDMEDDDVAHPETFGMMRNAMAPATMPWHKKQRNSKMHNATAPKKHGGTNSSAATQKWCFGTMLQHAAQHCGTLCHAVAYCTMLWHKKQHHGTKHNAVVQRKTALMAHCHCHGTKKHHSTKHNATAQKAAHGKMLQQIMEGHGTKHNAVALITLPWHKKLLRHTQS